MMKSALIARCGMNCGVCIAHLREKNKCPGCRADDADKPITRTRCKIKNCARYRESKATYCFGCAEFPCDNLKRLDKRYRTKYHMSMIDNLRSIGRSGIRTFLRSESVKWACAKCSGTVCAHTGKCINCGNVVFAKPA
jgi:hypothetical protein